MYARRAAVLCSDECTPRDGLSHAQKEGRRAWCVPAHARVVLGSLAAQKLASLRGNAADQAASIKLKLGPSRWSITIFLGKN